MKKIHSFFYFAVVLLLVSILIVSCKKDKDDNNNNTVNTPQNNNGLGNNPGFPTGAAFVLPSYVKITSEIRGGLYKKSTATQPVNKSICRNPVPKDQDETWTTYGSGTYVSLYIRFYNMLTIDTLITIPGGLIFIDSTKVYQHGIILQSLTVPLSASDTTYACIMAYCCNLDKSVSDWDAIYHTGPVTNNSELTKIINIMKNKQLVSLQDFNTVYEIQSIIWDVTDFNQILTQQQINFLNSLP